MELALLENFFYGFGSELDDVDDIEFVQPDSKFFEDLFVEEVPVVDFVLISNCCRNYVGIYNSWTVMSNDFQQKHSVLEVPR